MRPVSAHLVPLAIRPTTHFQAATVTLHTSQFEGGSALSSFRIQQLLPGLQAIHDKVSGVAARFVHFVSSDAPPSAALTEQLAALLTYGDPYAGPTDGALIVVTPRLGTVSPWASKATDIAHNCGLAVRRVERVVEYRIVQKAGLLGKAALTPAQLAQMGALLHDRMTESVMFDRSQALGLFTELQPTPMAHVDVLGGGKAALQAANTEFGLALAADEIDHKTLAPSDVVPGVTVAYGHYLAASCTGCHGATLAGGRIDIGPPDWPPAANLTPHASGRLAKWSEADFMKTLRTSRRPDGSELNPVMPRVFANLTDVETRALWAYLQTLPPLATGSR